MIGDERKLRHILSHILNNAVKFTEQGEIKFSVQKKSEDSYHFQIKDTGIGMSKENIDNLYDAFFPN